MCNFFSSNFTLKCKLLLHGLLIEMERYFNSLSFFIMVNYAEHKIDHFNHFGVFSGINKHIHTIVRPSPPYISRMFLSFQTEALRPFNSSS